MSRGSKNHARGHCRPCRDYHSPEGCAQGTACNFCHYTHTDDKNMKDPVKPQPADQAAPTEPKCEISLQNGLPTSPKSQRASLTTRFPSSFFPDHLWPTQLAQDHAPTNGYYMGMMPKGISRSTPIHPELYESDDKQGDLLLGKPWSVVIDSMSNDKKKLWDPSEPWYVTLHM